MKYLVDSNVWLEAITQGAHFEEAVELIRTTPVGQLATSDFALHTVGLVLGAREPQQFLEFLDDLFRRRIFTLHLTPTDLYTVLDRMKTIGLDFDDAFQYVTAERFDLRIVSFDTDFDRTPRGRLTRAQALAELRGPSPG